MPPIRSFWRALRSIPGAATSRFEWQAPAGTNGRRWLLYCGQPERLSHGSAARALVATGAHGGSCGIGTAGSLRCAATRRAMRHDQPRARRHRGARAQPGEAGRCPVPAPRLGSRTATVVFAGPAWQVGWYEPVGAAVRDGPGSAGRRRPSASRRCAAPRSLRPAFSRGDAHPHGGRARDRGSSAPAGRAFVPRRGLVVEPAAGWQLMRAAEDLLATFVVTSLARFGSARPSIVSRRRRAPAGITSRSASSTATKWKSGPAASVEYSTTPTWE